MYSQFVVNAVKNRSRYYLESQSVKMRGAAKGRLAKHNMSESLIAGLFQVSGQGIYT